MRKMTEMGNCIDLSLKLLHQNLYYRSFDTLGVSSSGVHSNAPEPVNQLIDDAITELKYDGDD